MYIHVVFGLIIKYLGSCLGHFLEILVMTRQNSHALDSEKVDRY